MKSIKRKMVIIICASLIIIFLIFLLINFFVGINSQTAQTQIVDRIHTQEESITIISPIITENITAKQEEDQLLPTMTSTITQTERPTLEPRIIRTSTPTITPSQARTSLPASPTDVPFTPTQQPTEIIDTPPPLPPEPTEIIKTPAPPPTATQVPIVSCGVSPSTIPGGTLSTQVYWAQFTPGQAGLGFDLSFDVYGSGQRGCSAVSDNSGYASCEGSAGTFPFGKNITVTFNTSVGKCNTNLHTN